MPWRSSFLDSHPFRNPLERPETPSSGVRLEQSQSPSPQTLSEASSGEPPLSSHASSLRTSTQQHVIARPIIDYNVEDDVPNHRQVDTFKSFPSCGSSAGSLYSRNSLETFSFGSPLSETASSLPPPNKPLSASGFDDIADEIYPSEVTPRPSVVGNNQSSGCSPLVQSSEHHQRKVAGPPFIRPGFSRDPRSEADDDSAANSPNGPSSDSGASLSGSSVEHLPSISGTNHLATTGSQTTVYEDSDDHQHPFGLSASPQDCGTTSAGTGTAESTAVDLSSDEDYGDSDDITDYSSYEGEEVNIEIGSVQFEGSIATHDLDRDERTRLGIHNPGRRGSSPIAIPGALAPIPGDAPFILHGRSKEGNTGAFRRSSRSLDGEFRKLRPDNIQLDSNINEVVYPAPISVPQSDSDWKNLEERNKNIEKLNWENGWCSNSSASQYEPSRSSATVQDDFDLNDWNHKLGCIRGITTIDPHDLVDIIGPNNRPPQPNKPNNRRPSAMSSRWLSLLGGTKRHNATTAAAIDGDSFGKAVRRWGGDAYLAQQRDWCFRREKADRNDSSLGLADVNKEKGSITDLLTQRGSIATGSIRGSDREGTSMKVDKERSIKSPPAWRGMRVGSQEVWKNDLVGRFMVNRRAVESTNSKGAQQRLVVQHFRDGYTSTHVTHNGPPVTIHKHSKAIAFSISRHYKMNIGPSGDTSLLHGSQRFSARTEGASGSNKEAPVVSATKRGMILLAPRRVQEAYTSTNTTRKLRSHGLLDDKSPRKVHESKNKRRQKRHHERIENKERSKGHRRSHGDRREGETDKDKSRNDRHFSKSPDNGQVQPGEASATTSNSFHSQPAISLTVCNVPAHRSLPQHSRRGYRGHELSEDYDPDDDDDDAISSPTKTPHSETYGTMDASLIERRQDRQVMDTGSNRGFLSRIIRGRGTYASAPLLPGQPEPLYRPPWITLASRNRQEQQQRVVENLNTSFKDLGLLPSAHRDKPEQKPKRIITGDNNSFDIFQGIPLDSLYMLLPLWPGETGPSEYKMEVFDRPQIPNDKRQYLLVYYKTLTEGNEEQPRSRSEGEIKKRQRTAEGASYDSISKDRASILLSSFHISARHILYADLQGTGVRVPDEGLTVTGPLEVAFRTMPPIGEPGLYECVLGVCHSREAGIQFYSDGLLRLGLCVQTSEQSLNQVHSEEYEPPEPDLELTPIGRAVIEMAWLGALALTSFGSGT